VIPILGAVPDGAIVLVSGLGSNPQCSVSVGVGTLAGSTIMLLTIPYALSIILGSRDKDPETGRAAAYPNSSKPKYENGFTLFQTCITIFSNIPFGAKVMMVSSLTYFIVSIPAAVYKTSSASRQQQIEHVPALVGMIVCFTALVLYCVYQVKNSHAAMEQEMKQHKLKFNQWRHTIGTKFGKTDTAIRTVFDKFDKDKNGKIDRNELFDGFKSLGLDCTRQQILEIMKEMNTDHDNQSLTFDEFATAIKKWSQVLLSDRKTQIRLSQIDDNKEMELQTTKRSVPSNNYTYNLNDDEKNEHEQLLAEMWKEMEEEEEDEEDEMMLELSDRQVLGRALLQLVIGTILVTIFSDPMVSVIENFSITIHVNAFFVSFILTPICSNASEIYSALMFAKKKSTEGVSLSLSALYGAACMNDTFVLGIFCALVYFKELEWTFLVETLVILLTIFVVGIIGIHETIHNWQALLAASMFPLSLLLVATLESKLDDSQNC